MYIKISINFSLQSPHEYLVLNANNQILSTREKKFSSLFYFNAFSSVELIYYHNASKGNPKRRGFTMEYLLDD